MDSYWNQPRSLHNVASVGGDSLALELVLWLTVCLFQIAIFEVNASLKGRPLLQKVLGFMQQRIQTWADIEFKVKASLLSRVSKKRKANSQTEWKRHSPIPQARVYMFSASMDNSLVWGEGGRGEEKMNNGKIIFNFCKT